MWGERGGRVEGGVVPNLRTTPDYGHGCCVKHVQCNETKNIKPVNSGKTWRDTKCLGKDGHSCIVPVIEPTGKPPILKPDLETISHSSRSNDTIFYHKIVTTWRGIYFDFKNKNRSLETLRRHNVNRIWLKLARR